MTGNIVAQSEYYRDPVSGIRIRVRTVRRRLNPQSTIANLNRQSPISIDNRQSQSTIGNLNRQSAIAQIGNQQSAISNSAARLCRRLKQPRHREIDVTIAACAIIQQAALWTLNPRDFADVPGLQLVS